MKATIYLDGKVYPFNKKLPKSAKLKRIVREEHYETPEYSEQVMKNAQEFFKRQREQREDLEAYHG